MMVGSHKNYEQSRKSRPKSLNLFKGPKGGPDENDEIYEHYGKLLDYDTYISTLVNIIIIALGDIWRYNMAKKSKD